MGKSVVIFGRGYVSQYLSHYLSARGDAVVCTSRDKQGRGIVAFDAEELTQHLLAADAIISTVPTDEHCIDPVLHHYQKTLSQSQAYCLCYLSSTSVYGDHQGQWVNEESHCHPSHARAQLRLEAEKRWYQLYSQQQRPVVILRLSGIYGPSRNAITSIQQGKDFTVVKPGQYLSRIHVMDICQAIVKCIDQPKPGEIFNLSDDEPASPDEVQQFAAQLIDHAPLKEVPYQSATLSSMGRGFYQDNKKVSSEKIKNTYALTWQYPNYRMGLIHGC